MITHEKILEILSKIDDPELHRPITELGMVEAVDIKNGIVKIAILLTIPGCPLKKKIADDVANNVGRVDGVSKVEVAFGVMNEEQRQALLQKLRGGASPAKPFSEETVPVNLGEFAARVIAVASGKGGVGKSTVTANLGAALGRLGFKVAILDADVYGFSIPRILGLSGTPTLINDQIVPLRKDNLQVISMGFFVDEDSPVIWRGPLLHKAITQFLSDVIWDKSDFLLLDLPPGTGDVTLTIAQSLPKAELLVVTTPQPVASHTAGRVARLAERTKLKVLGVVENMSYYEVNGRREYIFGKDGGKNLAQALNVPFLGEIPIRIEIREGADTGNPAALSENMDIAGHYLSLARGIAGTPS